MLLNDYAIILVCTSQGFSSRFRELGHLEISHLQNKSYLQISVLINMLAKIKKMFVCVSLINVCFPYIQKMMCLRICFPQNSTFSDFFLLFPNKKTDALAAFCVRFFFLSKSNQSSFLFKFSHSDMVSRNISIEAKVDLSFHILNNPSVTLRFSFHRKYENQ